MALVEKPKAKKAPRMKSLDSEKTTKESKIEDTSFDARPTLNFNELELPELKNWEVGKKYTLEVEVEQTGMNVISYGKNKGKMEATFKISKVGVEEKD